MWVFVSERSTGTTSISTVAVPVAAVESPPPLTLAVLVSEAAALLATLTLTVRSS